MDTIATRIDKKLKQIQEINGTPDFVNASSAVESKLRRELDDKSLMVGNGGVTPTSSDSFSLKYRDLAVTIVDTEGNDFLSITYKNAQGMQKEL